MSNWKFTFRQDQCDFIIATMDYIIARSKERLDREQTESFAAFAAARTKERAEEIRNQIAEVSE